MTPPTLVLPPVPDRRRPVRRRQQLHVRVVHQLAVLGAEQRPRRRVRRLQVRGASAGGGLLGVRHLGGQRGGEFWPLLKLLFFALEPKRGERGRGVTTEVAEAQLEQFKRVTLRGYLGVKKGRVGQCLGVPSGFAPSGPSTGT